MAVLWVEKMAVLKADEKVEPWAVKWANTKIYVKNKINKINKIKYGLVMLQIDYNLPRYKTNNEINYICIYLCGIGCWLR
jgi:hypothetical protein